MKETYTVEVLVGSMISDIDGLKLEIKEDTILVEKPTFMERFKVIRHSNNSGHHGETIAEHTVEVYTRVVAHCKKTQDYSVLPFVCLLHDLGKCYTCEWNKDKERFTFNGHGKISHILATNMIDKMVPNAESEDLKKVLEMVKNHDILQRLMYNRSTGSGCRYLRRFAKTQLANEWFQDLCDFFRCDGAHCIERTEETIRIITEDLALWRKENKDATNRTETET